MGLARTLADGIARSDSRLRLFLRRDAPEKSGQGADLTLVRSFWQANHKFDWQTSLSFGLSENRLIRGGSGVEV